MSMSSLLGISGKVKTLLDRLTVTRAANLDDLNATVSSRAAASTALSTAIWTSTKAGYLTKAISSINGAPPVHKSQLFASSGTWTRPSDHVGTTVFASCIGGGGGGGWVTFGYIVNPSSGGMACQRYPTTVTASTTVTRGAGGARYSGGASNTAASNGGTTTFDNNSCLGGNGYNNTVSGNCKGSGGSYYYNSLHYPPGNWGGAFGTPAGSQFSGNGYSGGRGLTFNGTEYGRGGNNGATGANTTNGGNGAVYLEWMELA